MSELFSSRRIATYLSIAAGSIGLTGCGSLMNANYTQSKWKVGISCPSKHDNVIVEGQQVSAPSASLDVVCGLGNEKVAPNAISILTGKGEHLDQAAKATSYIDIKYSWDKGSMIPDADFAQNPTISGIKSSPNIIGIINISDIHTIDSVSVEPAKAN